MSAIALDRAAVAAMDREDPLAACRERFLLPAGVTYLDGNSLGALPRRVLPALQGAVADAWGTGLIRSWNSAGWLEAPRRVGDKIGRLIGAAPGQVVATDSTSVNLFKLCAAALAARPGRSTILVEAGDFPTDRYVAGGVASLVEGARVREAPPGEAVSALDEDVAVLLLTHVHYQSARIQPLHEITAAAHRHGALVLWDLSHSAGPVPVRLDDARADFAVGCGYKYLNGGPGAPAYLYVAARHQDSLQQPITGWFGHAEPFAFEPGYRPAAGVARTLAGTPPILGLTALEAAVDDWLEVDRAEVRQKSMRLGRLFIELVDGLLPEHGVEVVSPRDDAVRGSHVSLRHARGYAVVQALIEAGIIGDFRSPDLMRYGFAPLYTSYSDVYTAVSAMADVFNTGRHLEPRFAVRAAVT